MLRQIVLGASILCLPAAAFAASRNFTDHQGNSVKAEMVGVKEGQVVLKVLGGTRKLFPLGAFSLDDRDFILGALKDPRQIAELMSYARTNTVAKVEKPNPSSSPTAGPPATRPPFPPIGPVGPVGPAATPSTTPPRTTPSLPAGLQQADVDMNLKEMYGVAFPTDELMAPASPRTWTDIGGQTLLATFDKAVEPGLVQLNGSQGQSQTVPLVNLSRADIDYIKTTLEKDLQTIVFPAGRFSGGTAPFGARVWTDRRGVQLTGKYKGKAGRDVILEISGKDEMYPLRGLSKDDRLWIEQEETRKTSQQNSLASATPGSTGIPATPSPLPGTGTGSIPPASTNPYAGVTNTPSPTYPSATMPSATMPSASPAYPSASPPPMMPATTDTAASVPNMNGMPMGMPGSSVLIYKFRCPKCSHEWEREGVSVDRCPQCTKVGLGVGGAWLVFKILGGLAGLAGVGWGVSKAKGS